MATKIKIKKGESLIVEGGDSKSLYWVQDGQLEVYKKKGKNDVLLGHVYTGELVGEMSFLDDMPRCASVKALTDCELLEIKADNYKQIFDGQPKWLQLLIRTLVERLRRANAKIKI
ncbi:MAG: cyclic nucleotide-binding domain-containing protein [Bacteriovoracaceae bacterium]|nr:cyclic nucleotide-binding domain-containing protein [Bacteriovoracaceae bacterium]